MIPKFLSVNVVQTLYRYTLLLPFFFSPLSYAQGFNVYGVVNDSSGNPIQGAVIRIMGTAFGDTSNADGAYRIQTNTNPVERNTLSRAIPDIHLKGSDLVFTLSRPGRIEIHWLTLSGERLTRTQLEYQQAGAHSLPLVAPAAGFQMYLLQVRIGTTRKNFKIVRELSNPAAGNSINGARSKSVGLPDKTSTGTLFKSTTSAPDTLTAFLRGSRFEKIPLDSNESEINITLVPSGTHSWAGWPMPNPANSGLPNPARYTDLGDGTVLGENPRLQKNSTSSKSGTITNVVPNKEKISPFNYNQLILAFRGNYELQFRAYDTGMAYRFVTKRGKNKSVQVYNELLDITFPEGSSSFFPKEASLYSHYEQSFNYKPLDSVATGDFCALPVRFNVPGDVGMLITEAGLFDYPGLFLEKKDGERFDSRFPKYPLEIKPNPRGPDRSEIITREAEYIATTTGNRSYPWRVFMISDDDRDFVQSNLVMLLSRPSQIAETDWIMPGKIAWDWYNANNVYGVDFESGLNNDTYKYYIDFAADNNLEYVILDEGWTKTTTEVKASNPEINIPELVAYGQEKGVSLILWLLWHPLEKDTEAILQQYSERIRFSISTWRIHPISREDCAQ